ncbi:HAD hydrolase-like protein [Pedobacter sp. FW305-3-2-15-E-R2A2]|uniref:HAD family hydrolase n=1 Tax=Pedobacter sp. FW305-3-2-15-E-R2A2 TaxID=3140251 RepID=UPI00313FE041
MTPSVIFDLDQTLVDTRHLAHLRKAGSWNQAYSEIKKLKSYDKIDDIFNSLSKNSIKIIIITMSPSSYCSRVIDHFGWNVAGKICYHDVKPNLKPHPEPFFKAVRDYQLDPERTISAGDNAIDIIASNRANIPSIACSWDSDDVATLLASNPTFHASSPDDLFMQVTKFHNLTQ